MTVVRHIVTTSDGSHTIYVPELKEHYHSIHGAVQESEHIFIKNGFDVCKADPVSIFEAGFGTGLNALLTATRSINCNRNVYYTSIEKYPLDKSVTDVLNHAAFASPDGAMLYSQIHNAQPGIMTPVCSTFNIRKIIGDLITDELSRYYDLIYFDAFGPEKQPEMWSGQIFDKISSITKQGGIFVTYSCKGDVKRKLRAAGFDVKLCPGPPGKRHIIRAYKI
jgi:tRNA U34 5-methylaminomethyl-2-thiouridine-forming methyltransferase MnmC